MTGYGRETSLRRGNGKRSVAGIGSPQKACEAGQKQRTFAAFSLGRDSFPGFEFGIGKTVAGSTAKITVILGQSSTHCRT